jgi:adenine deaminase
MAVYQVAPAQSSADTFHLCRDSVRAAKRRRAGSSAELPLLLRNCRILDVTAGACSHQVHQVLLQGGSISAVDPACLPETAVVIDCGGMVLMPGGPGT